MTDRLYRLRKAISAADSLPAVDRMQALVEMQAITKLMLSLPDTVVDRAGLQCGLDLIEHTIRSAQLCN